MAIGAPDDLGMAKMGSGIEAGPVAGIMAIEIGFELSFIPIGNGLSEGLLGGIHTCLAKGTDVIPLDQRQSFMIKRAQELPLPAIPDIGADGADIGDRQQQQQPKALGRLNDLGKVRDRLGIVKIAAKCRRAEQQMMPDQPGDGLDLVLAQAQSGPRLNDQIGTDLGMMAIAPFAEVMEEEGQIEFDPGQDMGNETGRQRQFVAQLTDFDLVKGTNRLDGVLIDRIGVIEAMFHQGNDATKFRNEASEKAGLVHAPKCFCWLCRAGQNGEEHLIGFGITSDFPADTMQILSYGAQRFRVNIDLTFLRQMKHAQHRNRFVLEKIGFGRRDTLAPDDHTLDLTPAKAEPIKAKSKPLAMLFFESGAENQGQCAHFLGVEIIVLHEALDRQGRLPVAIAHALGDIRLHVIGKPLLGPPGQIMEMAAHNPEKPTGAHEFLQCLTGENLVPNKIIDPVDPVEKAPEPEKRMKIAKPPFAFLDVWLQHIAAVTGSAMSLIALLELGLDKADMLVTPDLALELVTEIGHQAAIAPKKPGFQQACGNRAVILGKPDTVTDRARCLPHLETQIPKLVKQELDDFLGMRRDLVRMQEQEIDIGMWCQFTPPITADRQKRQTLSFRGVGQGKELVGGKVQQT